MRHSVLVSLCLGLAALCAAEPALKYPSTKKTAQTDTLHGVDIADPYRWLEDDVRESKAVAAWVEEENKVTEAYLGAIPARKTIRERITTLWNYPRYTVPFKAGSKYFFTKNDGLQNQAVLYVLDKLDGEPRVLLDPNKLSKDGTVALAGTSASDDGKYLAYSLAEAGSDWNNWHVLDTASGKKLDDELKWVKFTNVAWTIDSKGFFYSRFDEPKAGEKFKGLNLNQKVFYHKLGTPQAGDALIYKRPDQPEWGFLPSVTEDGKYLVLTTWKGTDDRYRISWLDLEKKEAQPTDLISHFENDYTFLGNEGTVFLFKTNLDAPRGRVIAIDIMKPAKENWKEIVPQQEESLNEVSLVGDQIIAQYLKDARSQVKLFGMDGKLTRELDLPGICTADGFGGRRRVSGGKRKNEETFYRVVSFALPPSIYRLDLKTKKSELFRQADVKFKPADYEVKQVFFTSKDGTKVPMFLGHKKGLKQDGNNPTLLYGYGGFNIALTPEFSVSRLVWMERGGVFAMPNLRGGGEYGEEWHKAGTKLSKQNVFNDFISAAEYLIKAQYTQPKKLAIQGGSNGGLLVGACMTQRPELFGACLPAVGVMDMLRFHKFTAGRYWVDDYGSPDKAEEFRALLAYSPYHNLQKGVKYPATLVTTADTDDRVVPGHSFKFIARLQECQAGPAPVLARIETRAGHGAGKPTAKIIEEVADQWAFLVKNLGMNVK
jgi:prolyl oligopeptidase